MNFQDPGNPGDDVAGWNNVSHAVPNPAETLLDSNGGPSITLDFGGVGLG